MRGGQRMNRVMVRFLISSVRRTSSAIDSRWLYSSNYLRIKNLTFGYKLPINPKFVSYARVYLSIENLAKWDSYYGGYSPEAANVGSGPGGATALGLDYGGYPNARNIYIWYKCQFLNF